MKRTSRVGCGLLASLSLLGAGSARAEPVDAEDDELIVERTVELEIRLFQVDRLPPPASTAVARFRVVDGEYQGSLFSLAYDYTRPVMLRGWDVHNASGYRRIGGSRVDDPPLGQWNGLLRHGSYRPVDHLVLWLTQIDLNEDDEDRRWHFTAIDSIRPLGRYDFLDTMLPDGDELRVLRPDR